MVPWKLISYYWWASPWFIYRTSDRNYSKKLKAGMQFTSKKVLQYAVILLGFGLNLSQVFKVGVTSLPIILVTIATALVTAYFIQKLFRLDSEITTLVGVGSSICGGSAIAATAPVIKAKDESIATAISVIFFFNILAALIFPHWDLVIKALPYLLEQLSTILLL